MVARPGRMLGAPAKRSSDLDIFAWWVDQKGCRDVSVGSPMVGGGQALTTDPADGCSGELGFRRQFLASKHGTTHQEVSHG